MLTGVYNSFVLNLLQSPKSNLEEKEFTEVL